MKTIFSFLCFIFLTSCAFLASPLGLMIEGELLKDAEMIIEYEMHTVDAIKDNPSE